MSFDYDWVQRYKKTIGKIIGIDDLILKSASNLVIIKI